MKIAGFCWLSLLLTGLLLCPVSSLCAPQNAEAERIRKEISQIKKSTDWDNAAAAKTANERIGKLMKELEQARQAKGAAQAGVAPEEVESKKELIDELAAKRTRMIEKVAEEGAKGKGQPHDLASAVRDEIVEEYKELADKTIKNPEYFQELDLLLVDYSQPHPELEVAKLERARNIRTLILTGGQTGAAGNLREALAKAAGLPLEQLYIINFRRNLSNVPDGVTGFTHLKRLGLFNNAITTLPGSLGNLASLDVLYLDANPLRTVLPVVGGMSGLKELGIAKTSVTDSEAATLASTLRGCEVKR